MHAEAALFDTLTNSSLSVNLLVRNLVRELNALRQPNSSRYETC